MKRTICLLAILTLVLIYQQAKAQPYKIHDQNGDLVGLGETWSYALPTDKLLFMNQNLEMMVADGNQSSASKVLLPSGFTMLQLPYDSLMGSQKNKLVFIQTVNQKAQFHTFNIQTGEVEAVATLSDTLIFRSFLGTLKNELYFQARTVSNQRTFLCKLSATFDQITIVERHNTTYPIRNFSSDGDFAYYIKTTQFDSIFVTNGMPNQEKNIGRIRGPFSFLNTSIGLLAISVYGNPLALSIYRCQQSTESINLLDSLQLPELSSSLVDIFLEGNEIFIVTKTNMYYFNLVTRQITEITAHPKFNTYLSPEKPIFNKCNDNYYVFGTVHPSERFVGLYSFKPSTKEFERFFDHKSSLIHISLFDERPFCHNNSDISFFWSQDSISHGVLLLSPTLDTTYFAGGKVCSPFASSGNTFFWVGYDGTIYQLYAYNTSYVSINDIPDTSSMIFTYPNPVGTSVQVVYPTTNQDKASKVHLYNQFGTHVLSSTISSSREFIDVHHLPTGIYFIKLELENQVYFTRIYKS